MKQYSMFLAVIFSIVLALPLVSAGAFSTSFSALDNEILPNETATFELAISNFGGTQGRFQVYTIDPSWVLKISPVRVVVPAGTSQTFALTLKPKTNVAFGSQGISINIKDLESGDAVRKNLFVAVKSYDSASGIFQTSVAFDVGLPQVIDPREPVPLTVRLRNRNQLNIKDMTLTLTSPHYSYETILDLEALAENTEYLTMDIPSGETPGDYLLEGTLHYRGALVTQIQKGYQIGSYATVTQEKNRRSFLFKTTNTFTLTNDGNSAEELTVRQSANLLERLFTGTNPEATYVDGQYVWVVTVPAGETITVTHRENYQYFIVVLLLIIVGIVFYFKNRSPILSLKEAIGMKKGEGVGNIKIRLFVKNRSNNVIQGVVVFDKVPRIAELDKTHEIGTLKPTKITKLKTGSLLQWKLDILEPYEERILTYSIKSKLKIIGRLKMPEAKIRFETTKGQERIIYSNNILVVK